MYLLQLFTIFIVSIGCNLTKACNQQISSMLTGSSSESTQNIVFENVTDEPDEPLHEVYEDDSESDENEELDYFEDNPESEIVDLEDGLCSVVYEFNHQLASVLAAREENFIMSPLSLSTLLHIVWLSAGGETKLQLENVLGYKSLTHNPSLALNNVVQKFTNSLNCNGGEECHSSFFLSSSTGLFVDGGMVSSINKTFIKTLGASVSVEVVDMEGAAGAVDSINAWATRVTRGEMPEILSETDIVEEEKMLLINIIYLKGSWASKFSKDQTKKELFYGHKETGLVDMMHQTSIFTVAFQQELDYTMVLLPYSGVNMSMALILPNNDNASLTQLMSSNWTNLLCNFEENHVIMENQEVDLELPRFNSSFSINLKQDLSGMGVVDLFDKDKADLSHLTHNHIFLNDIRHIANIQIDEEGTVASAVSQAEMVEDRMSSGPMQLHFNRPFILTIFSDGLKIPFFLGVVRDIGETNSQNTKGLDYTAPHATPSLAQAQDIFQTPAIDPAPVSVSALVPIPALAPSIDPAPVSNPFGFQIPAIDPALVPATASPLIPAPAPFSELAQVPNPFTIPIQTPIQTPVPTPIPNSVPTPIPTPVSSQDPFTAPAPAPGTVSPSLASSLIVDSALFKSPSAEFPQNIASPQPLKLGEKFIWCDDESNLKVNKLKDAYRVCGGLTANSRHHICSGLGADCDLKVLEEDLERKVGVCDSMISPLLDNLDRACQLGIDSTAYWDILKEKIENIVETIGSLNLN